MRDRERSAPRERRERRSLLSERRESKGQHPSGPVAQLAEQQTLNLLVEGSIPSGLTTISRILQGFSRSCGTPSQHDPSCLAVIPSLSLLLVRAACLTSGNCPSTFNERPRRASACSLRTIR